MYVACMNVCIYTSPLLLFLYVIMQESRDAGQLKCQCLTGINPIIKIKIIPTRSSSRYIRPIFFFKIVDLCGPQKSSKASETTSNLRNKSKVRYPMW